MKPNFSSLCGVSMALLLLALASCAGELTGEERAESSFDALITGTHVKLVRRGPGKCFDVAAAGTADGTIIQQWSCNGSGAQTFVFEDQGGGVYTLKNPSSGKCVDISSSGTADGTKVQLWGCNGTSAQKFRVQDVGGGYAAIVNVNSNKCLDVAGNNAADGTKVHLWGCNNTDAQAWRVESTSGGDGDGDDDNGLVWRRANLTNFESYPDPGSDECIHFNGCTWAGYFAFVSGKQSEDWVRNNNIAAVHSRDANQYRLKTLRLRQDGRQIDVKVYDMCSDNDCSGCCTQNASRNGLNFLIDIEKYTMQRFGSGHGIVEWACLDCN
jgi:hypothetical protein